MNTSPFFALVRLIVASEMRTSSECVTIESSSLTLEGWDSLAHVAVIARLAEAFDIEITDGECEAATSVAAILDMLDQKLRSPGSSNTIL